MTQRSLKTGTKLFFGAPANPMPEKVAKAIGEVVAQVPGIREAYLPQCFIEGDQEARQILVVGVNRRSQIPDILDDLLGKITSVLPEGKTIDVLPFKSSAMPHGARVRECKIYENKIKPWWRFW